MYNSSAVSGHPPKHFSLKSGECADLSRLLNLGQQLIVNMMKWSCTHLSWEKTAPVRAYGEVLSIKCRTFL